MKEGREAGKYTVTLAARVKSGNRVKKLNTKHTQCFSSMTLVSATGKTKVNYFKDVL